MFEKTKKFVKEHKKEIANEALRVTYFVAGCYIGHAIAYQRLNSGLLTIAAKGEPLVFSDKNTKWMIDCHKVIEDTANT